MPSTSWTANDLLANGSTSNSVAVIETVLGQDHVVMVEIDHIGKILVETEVPLPDAAVVADVIVHIVPNGLFGLIIYHHAAGKV